MKDELLKSTIKTLSNTAIEMIRIKGFENAKSDILKLSEMCELITTHYNQESNLYNYFAISVLNKMLYGEELLSVWEDKFKKASNKIEAIRELSNKKQCFKEDIFMQGAWLIRFKNGNKVILSEEQNLRLGSITPIEDVEVEEHWFSMDICKEKNPDVEVID